MSVRLDRLQRGLYEALSGVTDVVGWGYGQQPREAGGLLALRIVSGPALRQHHARGSLLLPGESLTLRVTSAVAGTRLVVTLNDYDYRHDVLGGESVTDIRDDLLAQILLGEVTVTASSSGADAIDLAAVELGGIRSLALVGEGLTAESVVVSDDAVLVTEGQATFSVEMQAFGRGREPRNGALNIVQSALDLLQSPTKREALNRWGVGLWGLGTPIDISAIAGSDWESRASADFTCSMTSVGTEPVDQIETVTAAFTVDNTHTITAAATA